MTLFSIIDPITTALHVLKKKRYQHNTSWSTYLKVDHWVHDPETYEDL